MDDILVHPFCWSLFWTMAWLALTIQFPKNDLGFIPYSIYHLAGPVRYLYLYNRYVASRALHFLNYMTSFLSTWYSLLVISLFVFRRRHSILTTVKSVFENTRGASVWDGFIEVTCQWWCLHAQVWHSYQVHGEQKLIELHQEKKVIYF